MTVDASQSSTVSLRRGRICVVLLMLLAGYALTLLVFYPGYVTVDAQYVYAEAKQWRFGDWQSPAMGVLWHLIDPIAPGALSMFLLAITMYWAAFGLLAFVAVRQSPALGILTPLVAMSPPAFFFIGLIWRDVLFAVVWLMAAALAFAAADRAESKHENFAARGDVKAVSSRMARAIALVLVAFGVLLRPNAVIAAPLLAAYVLWPQRFEAKRAAIAFAPALFVCAALVPAVYYGLLDAKRQNPLHSILVFDLGGITHFTGENQFPVAWSSEQTTLLTSRCYDPVRWDSYWHVPPCPFVMQRLEQPDDLIFGTARLATAWWRAVSTYPLAYLAHRAAFMRQFLARSNLVLPVWDWAPPDAAYGKRPAFRPLLKLHDALQPTLLFRPGLWLVLAGALLALAWRLRTTAAGAFTVGVTASALAYVMSFFLLGVASDFRYAYWCVLATLAGAVAAALAHAKARSAIIHR
jgi:hypothetical protein